MQNYNFRNNHNSNGRLLVRALLIVAFAAVLGLFAYRILANQPKSEGATNVNTSGLPSVAHTYGIAAGSGLTAMNDSRLDARLDGIAATGSTWVRLDFDWNLIQPDTADNYDWDTYDKIVAASTKRNIRVLGILTYTPAWARDSACAKSDKCQPSNPANFATFAAAVSNRYKDQGLHYWEIWNEPNNASYWQPKASPDAYTALLKQSATALRTADSKVVIVTGGLSPQDTDGKAYSPTDFLAAIYKAGAKSSFDAVADHPYTFPLSPLSTPNQAWRQMASAQVNLHQIMVNNGDSAKKIWVTEFGAPTGGPGAVATISNPNLAAKPYVVDEALQSQILTDAINLFKGYDWAGPFLWYSYQDSGTTHDTNENFFGLVRYDGSKKPAYTTFQSLIK